MATNNVATSMGIKARKVFHTVLGAVSTPGPVIWTVGMPPNMASVHCGTSPSTRSKSRASLDMPMLFWMSP